MLRRLALAALLCAGAAQAAHLDGPKFSVDYTVATFGNDQQVAIVGDGVLWDNLDPAHTWLNGSGPTFGEFDGSFAFIAAPGYRIDGYTVTYSAALDSQTWTIRGDEDLKLPIGTVLQGTGHLRRGSRDDAFKESATFKDSFTQLPRLQGYFGVQQVGEFCIMPTPGICSQFIDLQMFLVGTIAIAPTLLQDTPSPVPEPETWALMLAGLLLLHCSLAPMSIVPVWRAMPKKSSHTAMSAPAFFA